MAQQHKQDEATAQFLVNLARLDENSGRYEQALTRARRGLEIAQAIGDKPLQARAQATLGLIYRRVEEYRRAESHSITAREIAREIGDRGLESESLRNIGAVYQEQGDYEAALSHYKESLDLARDSEDLIRQAKTLNNMGVLYQLRDEYQKALSSYHESLILRKKLGDLAGRGKVLGNICTLYIKLNDDKRAIPYCERSLDIAQRTDDQAREANNLNNLAAIYRQRWDYPNALSYFEKSAEVYRDIGDRSGEARSLNNIGEIYLLQLKHRKALRYLSESLQIREDIGDKSGQSSAHYNMGLIHFELGEYQKALQHLKSSLVLQMEIGQPDLIWRSLHDLSRTYEALSNPRLAIFFGKQAVNTVQSVRTRIQDMEESLQRSYLEDKRRAYKHLANLLIDEGRLLEAQQVMTMLKEDEYFNFIRSHSEQDPRTTDASFSKMEAPKVERYRGVREDIVDLAQRIKDLDMRKLRLEESTLSEKKQDELEKLRKELDELKTQRKNARLAFEGFVKELEDYFSKAGRQEEFKELEIEEIEDERDRLKRLGAVLVHYLVTEEKLRMLVTGPDPKVKPIPIDNMIAREDLHRLIWDYRKKLQSGRDPMPEGHLLYQHLFAPIENDLEKFGVETVEVYLDGSLRYLPLSALYDSKENQYVAEKYAVVVYTAAAKDDLEADVKPDWRIAGLGVSKKIRDFAALPAVLDELDSIVREEAANDTVGILPGRVYLDKDFTSGRLKLVLYEEFPVIHLATHFTLHPGTAEDSFLLLGDGTRLSLAEFDKSIDHDQFGQADLLTLSACETALGSEDAYGQEVESFATLALKKDTNAVLATLWKVEDRSTAVLMERFYQLYASRQQGGHSKAKALQEAQKAFIDGRIDDTMIGARDRGQPRDFRGTASSYAHPYYWAPFILMGNWL